jgi:hypothetical protein
MDELTLLRDLDRTPLPDPDQLAPARAALLAAIATEEPPRRSRRRLVASGAVVAGLAAAITAVVALGPVAEVAPPTASAAEVLDQAAAAARRAPDVVPRPDQFVYTRSQDGDGSVRETWLSADGTRDGLIEQHGERVPVPGCVGGQRQVMRGAEVVVGRFEPCTPSPAYRADLPTAAPAMLDFLAAGRSGEAGDGTALGPDALFLVGENQLSPSARAKLFEAVGQVEGLTVIDNAVDAAGRPGIGVSWTHAGTVSTMVFDRDTHLLLGTADTWALLRTAIVDQAGQRP